VINRNATLRNILKSEVIGIYDSCYSDLPDNTIAEKIYKLRKSKGLGLASFSEITGINISSIQKWEKGVLPPSTRSINKLCIAFDLEADYFNV